MKKYSLLMGLMCAALSITSCSKDNTETFDKPKGYEFELYAAPQTRTEVDGLDMKWSANDAMNVFHAPTGTTNYSSNDQFTLAEIESGRFTGLITDTEFDPNGTYDWYAVYPYSKYMASPAESNSGSYFTVGSEAGSAQQQTGIDNQAHISGENIPLYGTATGVTGSPNLQMHHIATLFRINVTNTGSADLNVTGITLTSASENLIGSYYFDITGETPVLTPYRDDYVSKTATLNITDGVVAPDATGSFYLATRAFTAPEGEQLTLKVTANGETVEKVATLSKETTFAAGKINKLNVNMAAAAEQAATWEKVTSLDDITAGEYIIVNGDYFLPTTTTNSSPAIHSLESQGISFVNDSYTGIVPDIAKWTFTGTNTAMTITNSGGDYLYGEDDSKGIGVGSTSGTTWAFEVYNDGFAMKNTSGRYCAIYVKSNNEPGDWRSYKEKDYPNYKINGGILYLYKKGDARSALETPTGVEAVAEGNEVLVSWNEVSGAASYTVSFEPATIEPQTIESTGAASYAKTFTLDYATDYTVSVVANPADTENYKASAPATVMATTEADPSIVYTPIGEFAAEGGTYNVKDAVVVASGSNTYVIADETGIIQVYGYDHGRSAGEKINISGEVTPRNNMLQFNTETATVSVVSEGNSWNYAPTTYTATEIEAYTASPTYDEISITGKLIKSGSYYNLEIEGLTTIQGSIKSTPDESFLNRSIIVKGYTVGTSKSGETTFVNIVPYDITLSAEPYITADETASFVAAGETKTISFMTDNLGSNQVFAEISGDGAGQFSVGQIGAESITVTAVENTETTAKTATLTLYIAASEDGEHLAEATVALTQAGVSSGESKLYTLTILPTDFSGTSYADNNKDRVLTATAEDGSTMDVTINTNQVMLMSNLMQWQKNKGILYNKTNLGKINSVTLDINSGSFTVYEGSTENPSSTSVAGSNGIYTFIENSGYFSIKVGNATGKLKSITITFNN